MSLVEQSTFLNAEDSNPNGLTATLIHTTDRDEVIAAMFPREATRYPAIEAIDDEMFDRYDATAVATVHQVEGWVCVREELGWQGTKLPIATQLSAKGDYICAARDGEAVSRFILAVDGQIVRNFEPLFQQTERGRWYGEPLPEESGLEWAAHPLAAALTLQARLAGVLTGKPTDGYIVLCYDGLTDHGDD